MNLLVIYSICLWILSYTLPQLFFWISRKKRVQDAFSGFTIFHVTIILYCLPFSIRYTVFAAGSNEHHQTDTADWTDVVSITAGAYHSVGLTGNGTLLTTGNNTYGQCDTALLPSVRAVSAGYYNTWCVLPDGMAVCIGHGKDRGELPGVEHLNAGVYGAIAMVNGIPWGSHPSLVPECSFTSGAVTIGASIVIDGNGTTHCTYAAVPQWTDIVRVAASENGIIALAKDGTIHGWLFGRSNQCSFEFDQPVLDIAAGPNQFVFALADGTQQVRKFDGTLENDVP